MGLSVVTLGCHWFSVVARLLLQAAILGSGSRCTAVALSVLRPPVL